MQRRFVMLTAMCVVALALSAQAHHSHNGYEVTVWTDLEGTVSELHLIVPHSWVYLDVEDDTGETVTWALEAAGPNKMIENGAKREDVQVGDRIKVRCHLLRDGSNGCLLGFVTPDHGDSARGHGVEIHWD
ncbi:MAG: DUF6152 family protein [Acidobacteria bacterium]|nr:DUF6152 family protein [Acidobacteriota bacterium]